MSESLNLPPTFKYEKNGRIAVMTINRPEAMNAFTADMLRGMDAAFADFNDDDSLWVAILTATGDKAFSSGMDLKEAIPLHAHQKTALFATFATIVRATVKGGILVAVAQGALGGIAFWLLGIHAAMLWAVLMMFLSLVPAVGAGLVWVPVAIYLLSSGAVWQGVALILYGVLVIGLGEQKKLDGLCFQRAANDAARMLKGLPIGSAVSFLAEVDVPGRDLNWKVRTAALATDHVAYKYTATFKPKDKPRADSFGSIAIAADAAAQGALDQAAAIAAGVRHARELGNLRLRLAEASDEKMLLDWQAAPETRRFALNPAVPSAAEHHAWFQGKLAAHQDWLLFGEVNGVPTGYVRLDWMGEHKGRPQYLISIAAAPGWHGQGIGSALLAWGLAEAAARLAWLQHGREGGGR